MDSCPFGFGASSTGAERFGHGAERSNPLVRPSTNRGADPDVYEDRWALSLSVSYASSKGRSIPCGCSFLLAFAYGKRRDEGANASALIVRLRFGPTVLTIG